MKTIVFGFDGFDFRYLDRFASSLPTITALREKGVEAPLESTYPPWTGSAWPSMYTGTDPSRHGVYGFFTYDGYPDEGQLVSRGDVRRPALWDYLTSEGVPSVVLNVPVTHPAAPIEGVLVPGYLASEDEPGHPEGIREELSTAIGEEYRIYSRTETSDDLEAKFEGYLELIDHRRRATLAALEREEWELAVIQVQKTDAVFHHFEDDEYFRPVYEAADRLVEDVLESIEEDVNVVICSDHGVGPVTGYQIYVNEILKDHGLVETTDKSERLTVGGAKSSLVENGGDPDKQQAESTPLERTIRTGRRVASRFGLEPGDVYGAAERVGLTSTLFRVAPDSLRSAATESVDWRASRAYCADGTRRGIRINLAGREPDGVVPESEYEAVCEEIIEILSSLETPDGEPAFEFVCRREELYDGPNLEDAPDIFFLPSGMNHAISTSLYGRWFLPADAHNHKLEGVFVGAGPGIAGERSLDRLELPDVAPIVMGLLGRPVPSTMTGSVPRGLLPDRPGREAYDDVSCETGRVDPTVDDDGVTERLEDLGYL